MTEPRAGFRVLVDWDNDGFFNVSVPVGAPTNLLPYPAYCANLFPKNQPSSGVLEDATYVEDIHELGLLYMSFTIAAGFPSYFGVNIDSTSQAYSVLTSSYTLQPNTDYTLAFYIFGANNVDIKVYRGDFGATTETLVDSLTNVNITADWTRVEFDIADDTDATNFFVTVERNGGGNTTFKVRAVMLASGTTFGQFNCGELSPYDNISDFALSASWELGRNNFDDPIAYEGTARIVLDNDDKRFSPANTDSPLYGHLNQNLMIALEYESSINNWVRMWTGWTSQFKTKTGRTSTRQAEIICQQGIYRLRDGDLDFEVTENMTINEAILAILENSGFRSGYYPLITTLNFDARLGWNSWLQDAEQLFSSISTAYRYMELAGFGWGRKTSPSEAIEQMLEAEHSKLYIDRDGGLVLKHREDYVNTVADHTLNLGTDVQDATYRFGEDVINHVDVFVKPRKQVTNQVIWTTKEPIFIIGHPFGDGRQNLYTRYVELHFEFEEGSQRTITAIDAHSIKDMAVVVYNRNPRAYDDPSPYIVPASEWDGEVHATVLGSESLRKRLQVRNNLEFPVWIDIEISGDYLEGGEGGVWVVDDLDSQELIRSVQAEKIELPSATTETEAISYGNFVLHRKSTPIGEFTEMRIKDDPTIKVGDVISITEEQTGEVDRRHVVLGESGDYGAGGILEMVYKLARLDEQTYFTVDDTIVYSTQNVVQNLLDKMIISAGTYELVTIITPEGDSAYKFNGGNAGAGVLAFGKLGVLNSQVIAGAPAYDVSNYHNDFNNQPYSTNNNQTNTDAIDFTNTLNVTIGFTINGVHYNQCTSTTYVVWFDPITTDYLHAENAKEYFVRTVGKSFIRFGAKRLVAGTALLQLSHLSTPSSAEFDGTIYTITNTFRVIETTVTNTVERIGFNVLTAKQTAGDTNGNIYLGDYTFISLDGFVTEDLALEADITHYLTIWALCETDFDLHVKIVASDSSYLYNDVVNLVTGVNKVSVSFTPQSGSEDKHGIIIYPTTEGNIQVANTETIYLYGISVTREIPDTYKETNQLQNSLPVLYL